MHMLQNPSFRSSTACAGCLYNVYVHILGENLRLHVADLKTEESTEFRQDISSSSQYIKKNLFSVQKLKIELSPFGNSLQSRDAILSPECIYL